MPVKGLGGFHLAVDAHNANAVFRLRQRKAREAKPLAVMTPNGASARLWGDFNDIEIELLNSPARPIVLARKTERCRNAFIHVADDLNEIGLMTAYTPVHLLLFHALAGLPSDPRWLDAASEDALVMTSANPFGRTFGDSHERSLRAPQRHRRRHSHTRSRDRLPLR